MKNSELIDILHYACGDNNVVVLDTIFCMAKRAVHDCEMDGKLNLADSYKYVRNMIEECYNEYTEGKCKNDIL